MLLLKLMVISKKSVWIKLHSTDILNPLFLKIFLILFVVLSFSHMDFIKTARPSSRYKQNDSKLINKQQIK